MVQFKNVLITLKYERRVEALLVGECRNIILVWVELGWEASREARRSESRIRVVGPEYKQEWVKMLSAQATTISKRVH